MRMNFIILHISRSEHRESRDKAGKASRLKAKQKKMILDPTILESTRSSLQREVLLKRVKTILMEIDLRYATCQINAR